MPISWPFIPSAGSIFSPRRTISPADRAGADIIVIDDPLKPEEALSQTQRQAANEWYDHTLYSRLNDKLSGAIVLIMHRLHESLPSGMTRGTISPATYWRRRSGKWCACQ